MNLNAETERCCTHDVVGCQWRGWHLVAVCAACGAVLADLGELP
jgi:hypothetical protein